MWDNVRHHPKKIVRATLHGYGRIYNKLSVVSRGTRSDPGIVLGLRRRIGTNIKGVAILIDGTRDLKGIRDREQGVRRTAYLETNDLKVTDDDTGRRLEGCLVYLPNPRSPTFIHEILSFDAKADIAISSRPPIGNPWDYVIQTHQKALQLGIDDTTLRKASEAVKRILDQDDIETIQYVEVYGAPTMVSNDVCKIGLPKVLRDLLNVQQGSAIKVNYQDRTVDAIVYKTDKDLLERGQCKADNPRKHCWLNRLAREELGVSILPVNSTTHRNHLPRFKRKFTPVTLSKT